MINCLETELLIDYGKYKGELFLMPEKGTKRQLQAQRTRHHIYDCALKLYYQKGFEHVTVNEIVEAAGVSVGTFYHHFKSKLEVIAIYHETLDTKYAAYYAEMQADPQMAALPALKRMEEFLLFANTTSVEGGIPYIRVVYPYMLNDLDFGHSMVSTRRQYFRILRELGEEALRRGELRAGVTVDDLLRDSTIISRGCIVDWCINQGKTDIREHSRKVLHYYYLGVSAVS